MLVLAGILAFVAALLWIADSCLPDASIDFTPAARVVLLMAALLLGINTLIGSAG
mgnify:CR=1 FL=1